MNNVLVILGMHRSGTSLVANWLYECGLHLGDRLLEGTFANEKGYFEDLDFLELHEQVFQFNNIESGGFIPPLDVKLNDYYKAKLRFLIELKNSMRQQWGWKEPRTCLFLDHYKELLPAAKYFIVFRDYSFVVDSLVRRVQKFARQNYQQRSVIGKLRAYRGYKKNLHNAENTKDAFLKAWIIYNEKLLGFTRGLQSDQYILTDYETLLNSGPVVLEKMRHWGFTLNRTDFNKVFEKKLMKTRKTNLVFDKNLEEQAKTLKSEFLKFRNI